MTRRTRVTAWVVILALAAFQAYAQRYAVGPDGIAYLDLSDAATGSGWSRLVNLYWSPAYPALIGIARALTGAGPAAEIPVVHAVNFVLFAAMFGAFEYMMMSIYSLAGATPRSVLSARWGAIVAYVLFACFALTMIPLELTTPDLLNGAAIFLAFGAMLRLRSAPAATRHALILGVALGAGALAKSFMVPWALVCFATLALALRARAPRPLAVSVIAWAVLAGPWAAVLSHRAGRFTVGDAGRLTFAWFVNEQDPPALGGVPPNARTARTESLLPGVGITGDAPGTDPMWFDPARWNAALTPHFVARQQAASLKVFYLFYVQNLTPLLFLILLIAVAPRGTRRRSWTGGWVVYVPALADITAYAMVLVTSRYIMPFVLAGTLVLLATLPLARRMLPLLAFLGVVLPVGLEALDPQTILGLALVTSVVGGMLVGVFARVRSPLIWGALVIAGLAVTRIVFPPFAPGLLHLGSAALALGFWWAARRAVRAGRTVDFAHRAEAAAGLLLAIVLLLRLGLRLDQDVGAFNRAASSTWGNVQWKIASDLQSRGVVPGTRIALIGPHAESYWARTARVHIAASVPRNRATVFWRLPRATQDSLLAEFSAAGARVAIATIGPDEGQPDSSWTPLRYHGWMRALPAGTRP